MTTPSMHTGEGAGFLGGDTVKTVFWTMALHAFREQNVFRRVADIRWDESDGPMRGNPVTFTQIKAVDPKTSTLSETADPTPATIGDRQVSVTLAEYGNTFKPTKKLKVTSFLSLDLEIPMEVADHMEESVDFIARDVLAAGTKVIYAGNATSRVTVDNTDLVTANNGRQARGFLRRGNTPAPPGGPANLYVAYIHPDVNYDLQVDSGTQAWFESHKYAKPEEIFLGEIGALGGIRYVENANSPVFAGAGAGSPGIDVYGTLYVGRQALGEAIGEPQHMVVTGPFDDLARFVSVGWYGLLGYAVIRENSVIRVESGTSISVPALADE